MATRRIAEMLRCEECSQSSLYQTTIRRHLFLHWLGWHCRNHLDNGEKYRCDRCGQEFGKKWTMNTHIHLSKTFRNFCGSVVATRFLGRHLKSHVLATLTIGGLVICDECGYWTTQKTNVARHFAGKHNRRKDFGCDTCGMEFLSKSNLLTHQLRRHFQDFGLSSPVQWKSSKIICDRCNIRLTRPGLEYHVRIVHLR